MIRASRRPRWAAPRGYVRRGTRARNASDGQNLQKLVREAPAGSALEYVCAIAYVEESGSLERVFEGRCSGRMAAEPRGEGGFGYDPVFLPDESLPRWALARG